MSEQREGIGEGNGHRASSTDAPGRSPGGPDPTRSAYRIQVHDRPASIDALAWNALVEQQPSATPFLKHAYLSALTESGSAVADAGWLPQFVTVHEGEQLVAAAPIYLKNHSYGEYVFDWAWADAYRRHGLRYYPKLLGALPFTPVPGSRLLAAAPEQRGILLRALEQIARDAGLSSIHLLFPDDADQLAVQARASHGWLIRRGVQFHWCNRTPEPYAGFADFLADLQREKRKKIQQERRRVADAGVQMQMLEGTAISTEDWDFFYRCYVNTYAAHQSTPYLTREFFALQQHTMPEHWLMALAVRHGQRVAASLVAIDRARGSAFGRYWGAVEHIACLHFEACYYSPLAWCIDNGFQRFEGGAQGEHKMARGLLPVATWSAHWLAHPQFSDAVAEFLARESGGIESYLDELNERTPFKP